MCVCILTLYWMYTYVQIITSANTFILVRYNLIQEYSHHKNTYLVLCTCELVWNYLLFCQISVKSYMYIKFLLDIKY